MIIEIKGICNICKNPWIVNVNDKAYQAWRDGMYIQKAFPELSPGDRELLMSSICDPCFDKMFGDE